MMSKDGSEDAVVEAQEQVEGPATAVASSPPGVGAIRIRHILEKVVASAF